MNISYKYVYEQTSIKIIGLLSFQVKVYFAAKQSSNVQHVQKEMRSTVHHTAT